MAGEQPGPAPEDRPEPAGRRDVHGRRVGPTVEADPTARRAVLSALVEHEPGVLAEVAGLFARKRFNIESLTVGPAADPSLARMTIVVEEPDPEIEQVERQLEKLHPVARVRELPDDAVRRELAMIKVTAAEPDQVAALVEMYGGSAVDADRTTATVEVSGSPQKVEAAVDAFDRFGVREVVRTGTTALARGDESTTDTGHYPTMDHTND